MREREEGTASTSSARPSRLEDQKVKFTCSPSCGIKIIKRKKKKKKSKETPIYSSRERIDQPKGEKGQKNQEFSPQVKGQNNENFFFFSIGFSLHQLAQVHIPLASLSPIVIITIVVVMSVT